MQDLSLEAFSNFYTEVHGKDKTPFAWQTDLLAKVVADRRWPSVIDLPTGAGKTSCIDIALFALALSTSDEKPWCPRRIAMVVDRRVVVDQAARRGQKIAQALLHASPGSVCAAVAERLAGLSTEGTPLRVAVLRGGIPRDAGWARTPDQPLVIASTVDQLGSRLLFRGYGVSWSMRPVHAGLIGNDTLILLDEVHLSRPFAQTLQAITMLRSHGHIAGGLHVVALSATPGATKEKPFCLPDVDRKKGAIAQRISAKKPARLVECDGRDALVKLAAKEAAELLKKGKPHRAIAIVVNRVDSAHWIARELRLNTDVVEAADVVLLTGRMRPLDRDDRVRELELRVAAETGRRTKDTDSRPVIVVATQCIEAGADFDFDALVTEHASLDALRQRFGRVDRLGEYERAEALVIAVREPNDIGKIEVPKNDPIYGESLVACWKALLKWRGKKDTLGFGIVEIEAKLNGQSAEPLLAPKSRAPALFPDYLKLWAQTAPPPYAEPDVPLFLHGPQAGPADVQVIWRQDLDDEEVWKKEDGEDDEVALARVAALPPSSLEAVSVPFFAARRWLCGEKPRGTIVDLDRGTANQDSSEERFKPSASFTGRAIVWRGEESFILATESIGKLRAGDTVVLPAGRGGLYDGSFDPSAISAVSDIAERASFFGRGLAVLRRYDPILKSLRIEFVQDHARAQEGAQTWIATLLDALGTPIHIEVDESLVLLKAKGRMTASALRALIADGEDEEITQAETSSFTGRAIKLSAHSRHVETWARNFATKLVLATDLVETLAFAGWLHDVGKADPRFQQLLRGGSDIVLFKDRLHAPDDWLLAKSGMSARERRRTQFAVRSSGYPTGTRHEVLSLAMIQGNAAIREEAHRRGVKDMDLLFHLVASHHGWCRPFVPAVKELNPDLNVQIRHGDITLSASAKHDLERVDSPLADRFALLGNRYGWLQLAWFEAVLRLADHRASEQETTYGDA